MLEEKFNIIIIGAKNDYNIVGFKNSINMAD